MAMLEKKIKVYFIEDTKYIIGPGKNMNHLEEIRFFETNNCLLKSFQTKY